MASASKIKKSEESQPIGSLTKKASSDAPAIKPGSFLAKGGGMVPTVRLGKRASKKAI